MKVLVTGASGFIGNYVVLNLLNLNLEIICSGSKENSIEHFLWKHKVKFKCYDTSTPQDINLFEYFEKPDVVIHLAWKGLPNYNEQFHLTENLPNDIKFLTNLIQNGVKDIVVAGTCFEYGLQEGCLGEEQNTQPILCYSIAKDALRRYLDVYAQKNNCNFKWLRLFYMYGAGQNKNSLISLLEKAIEQKEIEFKMSKGDQIRDYLKVEDVSKLIVNISLDDNAKGIFNVCSGIPIKLLEFVEKHLTSKNKTIKLNLGYYDYATYEPFAFWGSSKKIKKYL